MATLNDKYPMHVANLLIDSVAKHKILLFIDRHSRYNHFCIAKEVFIKLHLDAQGLLERVNGLLYHSA